MAQNYNDTIHKMQTPFEMRAGLPKKEPKMLEDWEQNHVYEQMIKNNEGKPRWVLHDGPPYANGNIHMGTAMNKVLKDFINKSKSMSGYYTPYIPGWDNHGMPIESAIIKQNKLDRKKMSISEFRSACHLFAQKFVGIQMTSFKRLGVLGDWDHPYLTMNPSFEAEEVKVFGEMYKKGYIYKGLKPVYWCRISEGRLNSPRQSAGLFQSRIRHACFPRPWEATAPTAHRIVLYGSFRGNAPTARQSGVR